MIITAPRLDRGNEEPQLHQLHGCYPRIAALFQPLQKLLTMPDGFYSFFFFFGIVQALGTLLLVGFIRVVVVVVVAGTHIVVVVQLVV